MPRDDSVLGDLKTPKFPSEISWPLVKMLNWIKNSGLQSRFLSEIKSRLLYCLRFLGFTWCMYKFCIHQKQIQFWNSVCRTEATAKSQKISKLALYWLLKLNQRVFSFHFCFRPARRETNVPLREAKCLLFGTVCILEQ